MDTIWDRKKVIGRCGIWDRKKVIGRCGGDEKTE